MRSVKLLIVIAVLWWPSLAMAQSSIWTNEPAGSTTIVDCPFSQLPTYPITHCGIENGYRAGSIATDMSAPLSPPNVFKSTLSAGASTGGSQLNYVTPQVFNEMYMGLMWRTNPEFYGRPANNKTFFLRGPGNNGVWYMVGPPGGPFRMVFSHNSGALDNSHTCGAQLGLGCEPNVGSGAVPVGIWHKLEAYVKKSTTATSRDGIVRWWVDGALAGNYTNMNYAQNGLNEWVWSETWDGTVNPLPTQDWSHFLDHLRISIPNCPPGGCPQTGGGGTTPPPPSPTPPSPTPPSPMPPPPTGTPGTVSNLTVVPQSSTTALVSFTQQDDGTGVAAKYDNRLAVSPINWGAASSIASGPCASAFAPSGLIGSIVTCLLSGLTPGQAYQLQNVALRGTMNQGATYGSLGNVASFTMPSSNVPVITNFAPASGVSGVSVTLTGSNFGATIGANTVKCNGQTAVVTAASPTSLTFTVPDGVTTGKISVQTDQGIVYSDQNFTVGASGNGCGCS